MAIRQEILDRVAAIEFFHSNGKPLAGEIKFKVTYVTDIEQAKRYYEEQAWQDLKWDAWNDLTSHLSIHCKGRDRTWNELVHESKEFLNEQIIPKLKGFQSEYALDDSFLSDVQFEILNAVMEDAYSDCKGRPVFFLDLLKVYEAGHFPCGWDWANERLLVFTTTPNLVSDPLTPREAADFILDDLQKDTSQLTSEEKVVAALKQLVFDLAQGEYEKLTQDGRIGNWNEEDISLCIGGRVITLPPAEAFENEVDIYEQEPGEEYAVEMPLWLYKRRSDYTLMCDAVIEESGEVKIVIDDVHVL